MEKLDAWEARWAPYDERTYQAVLDYVQPDDVILDIGAGDLRLSKRMARMARHVFAIELQPDLFQDNAPPLHNLTVICGDARATSWPKDITLGVLLMRHCRHVGFYVARLRAAGCKRLVTNARWGLDVELVDLGRRTAWSTVNIGWYACTCGQTGFVSGPPEQLTEAQIAHVNEVETCPACDQQLANYQSVCQ